MKLLLSPPPLCFLSFSLPLSLYISLHHDISVYVYLLHKILPPLSPLPLSLFLFLSLIYNLGILIF